MTLHFPETEDSGLLFPRENARAESTESAVDPARLSQIIVAHHALVWRTLRRFGVPHASVDEGVSRVFDVIERRLRNVDDASARAFLVSVCVRVASDLRRADVRRLTRETAVAELAPLDAPSPEESVAQREELELLDQVLAQIDFEARAVFVLRELEELTFDEIAASLSVPVGTAKSRFRRAKEQFEAAAEAARQVLIAQGGSST